ncbi:YidH family protein [Niabella aquatica]
MENKQKGKPNDHLANERTFLAWIRTSIGIMGFGFIVVKFSMFIRQVSQIVGKQVTAPPTGYSGIIGVILVAIGSLTAAMAYINYKKIEKQIASDNYSSSNPLITYLTAGMVLISVILIWYLIKNI